MSADEGKQQGWYLTVPRAVPLVGAAGAHELRGPRAAALARRRVLAALVDDEPAARRRRRDRRARRARPRRLLRRAAFFLFLYEHFFLYFCYKTSLLERANSLHLASHNMSF